MSSDAATRWDRRHAARGLQPRPPAGILSALAHLLPGAGRALDLAGGDGRNSLWLAQRGLEVTLADVSTVGLELARRRLEGAGHRLRTVQVDLEDPAVPWPAPLDTAWDLVLVSDFLSRPLLRAVPAHLVPGGVLVVSHPTRRNLQRHPHPSARFLLDEGELPTLIGDLTVVHHDSDWRADGRHLAWLVARR